MKIRFASSVEGELARRGDEVVGVVIAPVRRGGDYWCRISATGVVHKGLTLERARERIIDEVRRYESERNQAKREAMEAVTVATLAPVTIPVPRNDFIKLGRPAIPSGKRGKRRANAAAKLDRPRQLPKPTPTQLVRATTTSVSGSSQAVKLNPCPICGAMIARPRKHYKKVHPRAAVPSQGAGERLRNQPPKRIRVDSHASVPSVQRPAKQPKRSKNKFKGVRGRDANAETDATRLFAHRYRDGGRFGSHASYDSYDDESEA